MSDFYSYQHFLFIFFCLPSSVTYFLVVVQKISVTILYTCFFLFWGGSHFVVRPLVRGVSEGTPHHTFFASWRKKPERQSEYFTRS